MDTIDPTTLKSIQDRLHMVQDLMIQTARASGRDAESVKLAVVTKKQPVELIRAVIEAGAQALGENYADEAIEKIDALRAHHDVAWHMIGHVQSRKAGIVCKHFDYVHSLDSVRLAARYDQLCGEIGKRLPVLLQVNVSGEETKSGWDARNLSEWVQLIPDIEKILDFKHLNMVGLMTMPPYSENPESSRPYFQRLHQLQTFLAKRFPQASWNELSMGMSGDYAVAIQEGATWVRIGQAIFGPRP